MTKKKKYDEGMIFLVPLDSGYSAIGLLIRINKNVLYGVFLNGKFAEPPPFDELCDMFLDRSKIILKKKFGIAGLVNGSWRVLGQLKDWDPKQWPVPYFRRLEPISGRYFVSCYNDHLEIEKEELVEYFAGIEDYPEDGTAGYGWIEKRLSSLIN